jgi:hypothetical protein
MGPNNDADTCVPTQVTDFIFDLSDSVTLSQIAEEQIKLYNVTFRELCSMVCKRVALRLHLVFILACLET